MQVDSHFFFKCVVPENIHTSPMEGYWKFQGGGGLDVQISKWCWGEKSNIFPEGPRALPEGNQYQYRIYDLINQEIDELQDILVYLNAICTFNSGHF